MRTLKIVESVLYEMVAACQNAYPYEACGILGGSGDVARSHYPLPNVADNPMESFVGDPKEHYRVLQRMAQNNEELIAIYHSHPRTPAVPSRTDIELAAYPLVFYAIVSLRQRERPVMRVFRLNPVRRSAAEVRWVISAAR